MIDERKRMTELSRKLATVRIIKDIQPIPGADNIEVVTVSGWKCVTLKDEFKVGDYCVYFEIDSFLPIEPAYEFLRKSSYRRDHLGVEGFRLRTIKLRKQVSQGLVIPVGPVEEKIHIMVYLRILILLKHLGLRSGTRRYHRILVEKLVVINHRSSRKLIKNVFRIYLNCLMFLSKAQFLPSTKRPKSSMVLVCLRTCTELKCLDPWRGQL